MAAPTPNAANSYLISQRTSMFRVACYLLTIAIIFQGTILALVPPAVDTYGRLDPKTKKLVVDKELLEANTLSPLLYGVFSSVNWLAKRFIVFDVDVLLDSARAAASVSPDIGFWLDEGESLRVSGRTERERYADTYWMRHLEVLVRTLNDEASPYFSPLGRMIVRDILVNGLKTQLLINQEIKRHPEILKEVIRAPIVIAGPPRTMTTHTQRILAEHPDVLTVRQYTSDDPFPSSGLAEEDEDTDADPRIKKMAMATWMLSYLRPLFPLMFPISARAVFEDIAWQGFSFGSAQFESGAYIPSYSNLWQTENNEASYRMLKLTQQCLQFRDKQRQRKGLIKKAERERRWVMKTPEHAYHLRDLLKVYPDAVIIISVRDPVAVFQSFIPMVTYAFGIFNWDVRVNMLADYYLQQIEFRLSRLVKEIDTVPKSQLLLQPFREASTNNLGAALKVCEFAKLDTSPASVAPMKKVVDEVSRDGSNKLQYALHTMVSHWAPTGQTLSQEDVAAILRKKFQSYIDKFQTYF